MVCSMRFYLDDAAPLEKTECAIRVLSVIKTELDLPCSLIEYTILDPDRDFGDYFHEIKPWTGKTVSFEKEPEQKRIEGKAGDTSAPIIGAHDETPRDKSFGRCRIEIWYPRGFAPATIKVDYIVRKRQDNLSLSYKEIIRQLSSLGIRLNNSFFHISSSRDAAAALDGMHSPFLFVQRREILHHYHVHSKSMWIDHIFDVFCGNSILLRFLGPEKAAALEALIGSENVSTIGETIVFTLPGADRLSPGYRIRHHRMIAAMRKILEIE